MLRCAGQVPSQAVTGLVPYISSVLKSLARKDARTSIDSADTSKDTASITNLSPHIALLCLWDMTEDVARSIASSIEATFETEHELLFGSPVSDSRKRKSGKNSGSETSVLPILPGTIALNILIDILCGSDPSSIAARELLLTCKDACHSIEKALERGTRHAEKILAADMVRSKCKV